MNKESLDSLMTAFVHRCALEQTTLQQEAINAAIMLHEGGMFLNKKKDKHLGEVYTVEKVYFDKILKYIDTLGDW